MVRPVSLLARRRDRQGHRTVNAHGSDYWAISAFARRSRLDRRSKSLAASAGRRFVSLALAWLLVVTGFAGVLPGLLTPADEAAAQALPLKMPVPSGPAWVVGQGYNTTPTEGGSHWNCDPGTLRDQPTQTATCRAHYQYQWSIDLARADGQTAYQPVLAPADGVIRWIDLSTGGMSIDLQNGYAFAFFHANLLPNLRDGMTVRRGQRLGVVSPPGEGANGGWPHLHITMWQTNDGGNWSRNAIPFSGPFALDGQDLPNLGLNARNQHRGKTLYSTNVETGGGGGGGGGVGTAPSAPVLTSPPNGSVYRTPPAPRPTLSWQAVSGATEYRVVINDGQMNSPWLGATSWTMGDVPIGQYAWQVQARNSSGMSALSPKWVFWINPNTATATPTAPPSPTSTPSPPPTGLTASVTPSGGQVGTNVTVSGGGMVAGEPVRVTIDAINGPVLFSTVAAANGTWSGNAAMPDAARGPHALIARGQNSGRQSSVTFTVAPSLQRSPINAVPGSPVTVTVRGFGATESVRLNWKATTGPVLGEARTDSQGRGSVTFLLPDAANGWHDYTGVGLSTGARAWGNFGVDPGFGLSATAAQPGQNLTATVRGYPGSRPVRIAWNRSAATSGTTLCQGDTSTLGTYTCTFSVPAGSGAFPVVAETQDGTTTRLVQVNVQGGTALTLAPNAGAVGTNVSITAGGFNANETVELRWNTSGGVWRTVTANASGSASVQATVPFLPYGNQVLTARGQSSGRTTSATYNVRQSMSLTPSGGPAGTRTTVYVQGFQANQPITIRWNRTSTSTGTSVCSGTVGGNGSYTCTFTVPTTSGVQSVPVVATAGSVSATVTFSLNSSGGAVGGGNVLGPGTYRVNTTREGLVGGTTSSGHVIVPADRFISLPACTATSCPWLAPGQVHQLWGLRVECGDKCYVRVVNPANGRCAVAPIKDVGPWYTNDDWWNPTETRRLNNLPTTVNILRQGYPGVQAARDGLNTGYGNAPSGVGISNKGYEVGNTSAVDIGDGTWLDLGFSMSQVWAPGMTVTMLWQSGEDPNAAARACGQVSANPPPGVNPPGASPPPGPTPTATPTASPTDPGRVPRVPPPPGVTPTPTATPTARPTQPARPPRVPPPPSATPTPPAGQTRLTPATSSVLVGQRVTLTGSGYAPNESIRITWNTANGTELGRITASAQGTFQIVVTIPTVPGGAYQFVGRGQASGRTATGGVSILPSLARSPGSGAVGDTVQVNVSGFGANELVRITWGPNNLVVATFATNANGAGATSFQVPAGGGMRQIQATGLRTAGRAVGTFHVGAGLNVRVTTITPGALATADLTGFPANTMANVTWTTDGVSVRVCTGTTTSQGSFTCMFPLPASVNRSLEHTVTATAGGALATQSLRSSRTLQATLVDADTSLGAAVIAQSAEVTLTVGQAAPGTSVQVLGAGFSPGSLVSATWGARISAGSATARADGSVSLTVIVPNLPGGVHDLSLVDGMGMSAVATLTITPSLAVFPDNGRPGDSVTIRVAGLAENTGTSVTWRPAGVSAAESVVTVCAVTTDADGSAICQWVIPDATPGAYEILAAQSGDVTVPGTNPAPAPFALNGRVRTTVPAPPAATPSDEPTPVVSPSPSPVTEEPIVEAPILEEPVDRPIRDGEPRQALPTTPTIEETATPSTEPSVEPTVEPTVEMTPELTVEPTLEPTPEFSVDPTVEPTLQASPEPSLAPRERVVLTPRTVAGTEPGEEDDPFVGDDGGVGEPTPVSTEEPVETPSAEATEEATVDVTVEPTVEVTPEPILERREVVLQPVADVSVTTSNPDVAQPAETASELTFGGPDGAVTYLTFNVEGVAPGTVVSATLSVTATTSGGLGGALQVAPAIWLDQSSATFATLPPPVSAALDATWSPVWIGWLEPWVPTTIDVTGTVTANGLVTFVLTGTPDTAVTIGSRESGAPPTLTMVMDAQVVAEVGVEWSSAEGTAPAAE